MRTDRLLLEDMLAAIDEVIETTPAAKCDFDANKLVRSHVLRHIQIIGEVAWRISEESKARYPQVPWKQMAGMRHVLVHAYFQVNWNRVYLTAREHVPPLRPVIAAMLQGVSER